MGDPDDRVPVPGAGEDARRSMAAGEDPSALRAGSMTKVLRTKDEGQGPSNTVPSHTRVETTGAVTPEGGHAHNMTSLEFDRIVPFGSVDRAGPESRAEPALLCLLSFSLFNATIRDRIRRASHCRVGWFG